MRPRRWGSGGTDEEEERPELEFFHCATLLPGADAAGAPYQLSADARAMTLELPILQNQEADKLLFFTN